MPIRYMNGDHHGRSIDVGDRVALLHDMSAENGVTNGDRNSLLTSGLTGRVVTLRDESLPRPVGVQFDGYRQENCLLHGLNELVSGGGWWMRPSEILYLGVDTSCHYCGNLYGTVEIDGRLICADCMSEYTFVCVECGEVHDVRRRMRGSEICRPCFDEKYQRCLNCRTVHLKENSVRVDGLALCPDCIERNTTICSECGERHLTNHLKRRSGKYLCDCCMDTLYPICHICRDRHVRANTSDIELHDGSMISVCSKCGKERISECSHCGGNIVLDSITRWATIDGNCVCSQCLSDLYQYCSECDTWHPNDVPFVKINLTKSICESCLTEKYQLCDHCGIYHRKRHVIAIGSKNLCENCYDTLYPRCYFCGGRSLGEVFQKIGERHCCSTCYERERTGLYGATGADMTRNSPPEGVANYSYKPTPIMYPNLDYDDPIYFGIELEADRDSGDFAVSTDAAANKVNELLGYSYVKHDGSLREGLEIVTHPAKLSYHLQEKREAWIEVMRYLREAGFVSHTGGYCGLHVHISSRPIEAASEDGIDKILYLWSKHWKQLVRFSRRSTKRLEDWSRKCNVDIPDAVDENRAASIAKKAKGDLLSSGRYQAVNLQNSHTIEFRMLRGTLIPETFFASLQLIDRIVKVSMSHSLKELRKMTWEELTMTDYPELTRYLESRKLITGATEAYEGDNDDGVVTPQFQFSRAEDTPIVVERMTETSFRSFTPSIYLNDLFITASEAVENVSTRLLREA